MEEITIVSVCDAPKNFTGIANISWSSGRVWLKNGLIHREGGPAVEEEDGRKKWYLEGVNYSQEEFNEEIKTLKTTREPAMRKISFERLSEIPKNFTGFATTGKGSKHYFKNGTHHRDDGPAIEYWDGNLEWWLEGIEYLSEREYNTKLSEIARKGFKAASECATVNAGTENSKQSLEGKKENQMANANSNSYLNRAMGNPRAEITDAAWNVGTDEFISLIRVPLAKALATQGGGGKMVAAKIAMVLNTDIGKAAIAAVFAFAVPAFEPMLPEKYQTLAKTLALKLRTKGYEAVMSMFMSNFSGPLQEAIEGALNKVMVAEKLRVNLEGGNSNSTESMETTDAPKFQPVSNGR